MIEKVKAILISEASAINNIPVDDNYEKAIEIIYEQVHKRGGKLVTSGMGKAGQIAHNIATTFSSTGTPSIFLHPSEAQHVILAISNSGKTREIIELISLKNNLYPGIPVIVITGNRESPLAERANCSISTGAPAEVCPLGLTPTTSTTVMTVIGDALVVLMMGKIEFGAADYAHRHHGGYLGMKSREISG
jgi:arabinose-5-phosphate isomerase